MLANLKNIFKVPDLRNKVLFTLLDDRALPARVPTCPSRASTSSALQTARRAVPSRAASSASCSSSRAARSPSFALFALGIMPYITASIIMQILAVVIPKLEQWQNQGAVGQRKITQWTRYVTIGIAIMQATGLAFLFHNGGGGFGRQHHRPRPGPRLRRRGTCCSSCSPSPPAPPC